MLFCTSETKLSLDTRLEVPEHRPAQVVRDLKRSSDPTFHGKGSLDEMTYPPFSCVLKNVNAEERIEKTLPLKDFHPVRLL